MIGRERLVLHDDLEALLRGPVERQHQQVQIHRQRIQHGHLLVGVGAHQPGCTRQHQVVDGGPRALVRMAKMPMDAPIQDI